MAIHANGGTDGIGSWAWHAGSIYIQAVRDMGKRRNHLILVVLYSILRAVYFCIFLLVLTL